MSGQMILVGQYDSPYVRRVAISLRILGSAYEHGTRSVFADFDAMRRINPLGRIPSLVLPGGETPIDSTAILDWLDETVGPERALAAEPWPAGDRIDQAQITTACLIRYVRMADPDLLQPGRYPTLEALSARCEARPEFQATYPVDYAVPRSE